MCCCYHFINWVCQRKVLFCEIFLHNLAMSFALNRISARFVTFSTFIFKVKCFRRDVSWQVIRTVWKQTIQFAFCHFTILETLLTVRHFLTVLICLLFTFVWFVYFETTLSLFWNNVWNSINNLFEHIISWYSSLNFKFITSKLIIQ